MTEFERAKKDGTITKDEDGNYRPTLESQGDMECECGQRFFAAKSWNCEYCDKLTCKECNRRVSDPVTEQMMGACSGCADKARAALRSQRRYPILLKNMREMVKQLKEAKENIRLGEQPGLSDAEAIVGNVHNLFYMELKSNGIDVDED